MKKYNHVGSDRRACLLLGKRFAAGRCLLPLLLWLALAVAADAAYVRVQLPVSQLPTNHPYQQTLRAFLGTLRSSDFAVVTQRFTAVSVASPDAAYALWLLALGPARCPGEATLPPEAFTLAAIEGTNGLALPADQSACQPLAWLAAWDYPGNPYRGNRAIQLRAITLAIIDLVMLDTLHEKDPRGADRSDYLGGNLIWIGNTYRLCGQVLPPDARAAFETGLKKLARRLAGWGPTGAMTDMDLFAPVGLWYIQAATGDPEMTALAERYARRLFTEPSFFNSAGYFVDNGCFDTSYNGISLYFGAWAALVSDWAFAREAMDKSMRLRAHLSFPDPGGTTFSGPSAMSSRTSGDPPRDQWQFLPRMQAAGMLSEEGLITATIPDLAGLSNAPALLADSFNSALAAPMKLQTCAWAEGHWGQSINFAADLSPAGHGARLRRLQADGTPLLLSPFLRKETFVRAFGDAFVIARFPGYAFAVHTGPVGRSFGHNNLPYGYGGGQLAAFWTPDSGAAWLTRRRGVQGAVYDSWAEWRAWPIHAVSGCTAAGAIITSARIRQPVVEQKLHRNKAAVTVRGAIPMLVPESRAESDSGYSYARVFSADPAGITVETTVTAASNAVALTELYETLPLMLRETAAQTAAVFQVKCAGQWQAAMAGQAFSGVEMIRADRFGGAMEIVFARPRAVRFAPAWKDGFQTTVELCTALVDLLESGTASNGPRAVRYTVRAAAPRRPAGNK